MEDKIFLFSNIIADIDNILFKLAFYGKIIENVMRKHISNT